ncbi:MAG: CoA-binding protein [Promethearchaeota archaeon]
MRDLSWLPHIKRVALIGASKKRNYFFLRAHATQFKGEVVVVKPGVDEIPGFPGVKVYPSIKDVPGELDFAFVALPREQVPRVVQECVDKGIKLVSVFTAEFSDSGTEEGRRLEAQIREILENGDFNTRLLGPNGMGLYYPKVGLAWRPKYPQNPGVVNVIFQSGGLSNLLIHASNYLSLPIGKVFSFGNGVDLDFVQLLEYSLGDPECQFVVGYLEGIRPSQGAALRELLLENAASSDSKPVVVLKGGKTPTGKTAAQTHTASIGGGTDAWYALLKQYNAIQTNDFDDLVNLASYLHCYGASTHPVASVCVVSLSGGFGVVTTDLFEGLGFTVPQFSPCTQDRLNAIISASGTSARNPVDLSVMIQDSGTVRKVLDEILGDELVDGVYIELPPWYFDTSHRFSESGEYLDEMVEAFSLGHEHSKPVVVSIPHVGFEDIRREVVERCMGKRVPVFSNPREVISVFWKVSRYLRRREPLRASLRENVVGRN